MVLRRRTATIISIVERMTLAGIVRTATRAGRRPSVYFGSLSRRLEERWARQALEIGAPSPGTPAPPWTCWSRPAVAMLRVLGHVRDLTSPHVVECGAGVSTLYIASQLRSLGRGHLWSIESDPEWARQTRALLEARGLEGWATIVVATITDVAIEGRVVRWYDRDALAGVLALRDVGLLLVDGPPALTCSEARFPALPAFAPILAPEALVILDDAYRADEQAIVARWCAGGRWRAAFIPSGNGLFELRRLAPDPADSA
jgi:hypothetical protein